MTHDLRMMLPASAAWAAAVWLTSAASATAAVVAVGAMLIAAVAWQRLILLAALGLCVAAVAASCAWRLAIIESSPVTSVADRGGSAVVDLEVRRDPRGFEQHGQASAVVAVVVHRISVDGENITVHVRATAFVRGDVSDLSVGRSFRALGRLSRSDDPGEAALISVVRRDPSRTAAWWWTGSEVVRDGVRLAVSDLDPEPGALVPALVMGDDSRLDDQVQDDFRRSGLTHLLAVSGTNLTIVLVTVLIVGRAAGMSRRFVSWAGVLAVVGFVLLARPDPSVLRAAAMGAVGLAAVEFGGRGGMRALAWAVLLLVFVDPWLGRSIGFVLSVCATAGIIVLAPALVRSLAMWMPRWCAVAVAVPLAAQLACTPTIAAISGQISLVAVGANLAAAPAVAPATVAGLLGGLAAIVWPALGRVLGFVAGGCADWILLVGHRSAGLAGASVGWSLPWLVLVVLLPLAAIGSIRIARRPVVVVGLCVGLVLSMWRPPTPGWPPEGWLLAVCDVGQGSAYVVNGGAGAVMVVDAGPDVALIHRCLGRLEVGRIDVMVFTHHHADHIDGWPGVRRGHDVGLVVVGASGGPAVDAPVNPAVAGESWQVGHARVQVVWPLVEAPKVPTSADGTTMNDASVVLMVENGGVRILLTGDVEPDAQEGILRSGADLHADVMTVPHHGSARQSEQFVDAIGASIAIVSVGTGNDYGHPAATALRMLSNHGAAVWRTDLQGDVLVVKRGASIEVQTR